MIAAQ
jgi:hypothetical protein